MTEPFHLMLSGEKVPVRVRRNAQAKRMILRICETTGDVKLTLPKRAKLDAAHRFVAEQAGWIEANRHGLGAAAAMCDGAALGFRGMQHRLCFTGTAPRRVACADGVITVGGPKDLAAKRLLAWLKAEARKQLVARASHHATGLGTSFARLSIGDMKSRWGSCSSRRTLRFNWRLIMAPDHILDYVAAHEVAHLLEMNHGPNFWAHVATVHPGHMASRRWLKSEAGRALMRVRFDIG